jgi:hypothetical protein
VREVIDTALEEAEINRFINQAYLMAIPCSGNLGDCGGQAALAEIQAQLAAHFIAMSREFQPEQEAIGGEASVRYRGKSGTGLEATTYGQNAMMMDCSGQLARMQSQPKRASMRVWTHEDVDYDYDD